MPVQSLPQFGRIFITAARHDTASGSERYAIRLTEDDLQLAPFPDLGDRFTLLVHRNGSMQAEYLLKSRAIRGVKRVVKAEAIAPLLNRMASEVAPKDWPRLIEHTHSRAALAQAFPAITFDSRQDMGEYMDFARALRSTRDKLGLSDDPPPLRSHQRVWARIEHLAGLITK